MEWIAYCIAAFLSGFLLAWLIKKSAPPISPELAAELDNLKTQTASLETEKKYLEEEKNHKTSQLTQALKELNEHGQRLAEYITRLQASSETVTVLKEETAKEKELHWQSKKELIAAQNDVHRMKAEIRFKEEQLATQQQQFEALGHKFENQFKLLAQNILEEKTKTFNQQQETSLNSLLNPLKENIQQFKTEFEAKYKAESDERISLREQVKHMIELNNTLSAQANNLTNALRGQVKQQGNWGEMILESILEYADLQKGIHYFVQQRAEGEEGQALQPDVIVRYPDERSIVIDAKVSLLHYEQYSAATGEGEQQQALNLLLQSVYRHIDGLSGKNYQDAVSALDFVMLFVPVEGAYITIMQADRQLWQYAYKKRVLLISPTNLIAAMKLVYDLWKREGINQNAHEVAQKAVKIYEKLAAFVEDFEKVGQQLDKASASFKDAQKKLNTGRGNVISQASQMKQKLHHTKPVRELPSFLVEQALAEDEAGQPGAEP
ncbi:DNA recombination protein RmuC [Foetidibacter luteolus]|uniref:DNA recombination protein RmuC n=1 Tax=Foetidibacter luteolus TaxID=2608880 RepID=UPI00129B1D4D|nr:DNA recombination protein RmuC [Foetidibacter luteolus]